MIDIIIPDFVSKLVLGTLLGGIIGAERERAHKLTTAGLRSFSLIALFGTICGIIALSDVPFGELFPLGGVIALIIYTYYLYNEVRLKIGITTFIALPIIFLAGLLVGIGLYSEGVISTFIVLGVLYIGHSLHQRIEKLKPEYVNEIIQFSLIFFVLYPLIPKEPIVVWGVVIDFMYLFLLILLISLINLAAFLINLYTKGKATLKSGFFYGIINSTAAIYFFSKKSKESGKNYIAGATAAILGSTARNVFLIAILLTNAFLSLLPFFIIFFALLLILLFFQRKEISLQFTLNQPFNIINGTAIVVALFSGMVLFQFLSQHIQFAVIPAAFLGSAVSTTFVIISLSASAYYLPLASLKAALISSMGGSLIVDILAAAIHRPPKFFKYLVGEVIILLLLMGIFLFIL